MNYSSLSKEVLAVIKPPLWDPYYYVSILTRKAYERAIPAILKDGKKYNILDYGCGSKPYKYLFEGFINKYSGVDVGENKYADYLIQPGEKLNFPDNEFDIILSSQVLEHVQDVEGYMHECKRLLKPAGIILLSTHGTWQYHASPYDFNRWTIMGLKELMNRNGFKTLNIFPVLGQFALTSQLRLSFYNSVANMIGKAGRILLMPLSFCYQVKMIIEDALTPRRVKERDSAIFLFVSEKS
jgi:SAM-dependent methyltransferase